MAGNVELKLATATSARRQLATFKDKNGGLTVDRKLLPFYVRIPYYTGPNEGEEAVAGIYLYSQYGEEAANMAAVIWNKWFRSDVIATAYPKIKQEINVPTTFIDDGDYDSAWRDAKKLPHYFIGHPDDPVAFMVRDREIFGVDDYVSKKYF